MNGVFVGLRSIPLWAWALLCAVQSAGLLRDIDWMDNFSWMLNVVSGTTLLLTPVSAALTAFLVYRNAPPDVATIAGGSVRGRGLTVHIGVAVGLAAVCVQTVSLLIGFALCAWQGAYAASLVLPWQAMTGPAALLAGTMLGAIAGRVSYSVWTAPAVLLVIYLAHMVGYWGAYPELFTTELATADMRGYRPVESLLIATVAVNTLTAGALACVGWWAGGPRGARQHAWLALALTFGAAAMAIAMPFVFGTQIDTYEPVR